MPGEYDGTKGYETDDVVDLGGRVLETVRGYRYYLGKRTKSGHTPARRVGRRRRAAVDRRLLDRDRLDRRPARGVVALKICVPARPRRWRAPEIDPVTRSSKLLHRTGIRASAGSAPLPATAGPPRSFGTPKRCAEAHPNCASPTRTRRPGRTCSASRSEGRLLRRARGSADHGRWHADGRAGGGQNNKGRRGRGGGGAAGGEAAARAEDHHAVGSLLDVVDADALWLVLELGETTLKAAAAAAGGLPEEECRAHVLSVAQALDALHALGFVHNDVKPANVLLVGGAAKLIDFGLASRRTSSSCPDLVDAENGEDGGRRQRAPRRGDARLPAARDGARRARRRRRAGDAEQDAWGLGVTLLAALLGANPFDHADGDEATRAAILGGYGVRALPRLQAREEKIGAHTLLLLRCLLRADPIGRWSAAQLLSAMVDDDGELRASSSTTAARRRPPPQHVARGEHAPRQERRRHSGDGDRRRRPRRRRRRLLVDGAARQLIARCCISLFLVPSYERGRLC